MMARISGTISDEQKKVLDEACKITGLSQSALILEKAYEVVGNHGNTLQNCRSKIKHNEETIANLTQQNHQLTREAQQVESRFQIAFNTLIEWEQAVKQGTRSQGDLSQMKGSLKIDVRAAGIAFDDDWFEREYQAYKRQQNIAQ